jgi:hypothetical protein
VAWGLLGDDGGMNGVGLGLRYRFGRSAESPRTNLSVGGS